MLKFACVTTTMLAGAVFGQIKFTDAFPGTKFSAPVYFGSFPGKAKTYVVLEQHKGLALLVSAKAGGGFSKDTLVHIDVNQAGEMGFLGIAFHPDFNTNHKYYVSYDPPEDYFNMVDERVADATGMKDSGTKPRTLIKIPDLHDNHNGGTIAFGPKDHFLYFGTGDGGSGNDPDANGQNVNAWLGKFHRIDVDKRDAGEYGIPPTNPFATAGGRKEIFAYGFRNPWKWSFDALTGDLWVGDVGQDAVEEVDIVTVGGNYGWKIMEGKVGTNNGKMTLPIFTYNHPKGNCIIGGVVFRGDPASKYYGTYFVSDIGTSLFWNLKKNASGDATVTELNDTPTGFSSFGSDPEGRIYGVGYGNGTIYLLDGPDLHPNAALRDRARLPSRYGRTFTASPGSPVDAQAFAKGAVLEIFNLGGNRLGALRQADPSLPPNMDAGIYLLRAPKSGALPDVLMVR